MPENPYEAPKGKSALPIIVAAVLLLAMLGVYVGAYLGMGVHSQQLMHGLRGSPPREHYRHYRAYRHKWVEAFFEPAAWIEGAIRGEEVRVVGWDGEVSMLREGDRPVVKNP